MKDKLNELLDKLKLPQKKSYYGEEEEEVNWEEKAKELEKENQRLKSSFREGAIMHFKNRRSIRRFNTERIPDFELLYDIIEAGLNAPVAGNLQNYRIILVEDDEKKKQCAALAYQQYWVADAPYLLAIVRDDMQVDNMYPDKGQIYSIQNVAAVIENIIMATHMSDLAACWVGVDDSDAIKAVLGVPENMHIDALIPIGFGMESPQVTKNPTVAKLDFNEYDNKVR